MKIHIVSEGKLEISVARRLIVFCGHSCGNEYNQKGSGNIKKKAIKYRCLIDEQTAVLILTDFMDSECSCLTAAKKLYLGNHYSSIHPNFLLRFAVNELESWLLADRKNMASMLGVKEEKIPLQPDMEQDPKKCLAKLAHISRKKAIKNDLFAKSGRQGTSYLEIMEKFVNNDWNIEEAMRHSPSLERCIARLRELSIGQETSSPCPGRARCSRRQRGQS